MANVKQNYLTKVFNSSIMQVPGAGANNQGPFLQASDIVSDYIVYPLGAFWAPAGNAPLTAV